MRCEQCGAEADAKSLYCPKCGNQLTADAANATDAEPTARDRFSQAAATRQRGVDTEQPLWQGSYSPKAMIGSWIGGGVATLLAVVCGVMFLQDAMGWWILIGGVLLVWVALALTYLYRRYSVNYELTSQRFIHQHGLLWRTTDRVELIDIDDVTVTQGPVERMLDVGTIQINSSDTTHPKFAIPGIDRVREVAGVIDDERRKERRRRGLHIEAV
ncbi:MAG: PH domain-containing protein [Pirellulales bacterium]